ncbi:MAG: CAP domain-containing protein [Acidobacteriaceae bacterium]
MLPTSSLKRSLVFILFLAATLAASAQQFEPDAEGEILRLVNQDRAQAGLDPLELDSRLTEIARKHSELMVERSSLSHQFPGEPDLRHRVVSSGVRFDISGENVAYDREPVSAERSLMRSPPHRANILRPEFNAIGIGVIRVGDSIYVTQDFARRLKEFTPAQAESAVSRSFEQLRLKFGAPLVPRVSQPSLRQIACDMAHNDRLETDLARDIANVRSVLVWTASDPRKLPADMQKLKTTKASGWSVGACFASSQRYPNPVWWMVAVTYF